MLFIKIDAWRQECHTVEDLGDNGDQNQMVENCESDADSIHNDHCTDTEQSDTDNGVPLPVGPYYIGRDNESQWSIHPPRANVRTARQNIVR